ncbi:hypothetical protein IEN85_02845 [Pelagicoccus sp. NFK12]|uniref:Uncharacterized protein n=1 Tax=Pelagicoccus enzymogenes TaxID=2773457 RepID=A0A927F761_9BACT|nr:hypothetical protein [Pelagicoccus enzymogenes]MBD5778415.1 hypothetical protein [Pelagicoccus enzymogenes]MDQ8197224.1 hypothetical protein [Pelagicoccus enzymogenes]
MKLIIASLALALASIASAADGIPVYLDPAEDSLQVGELEAISLAVPANWPRDVAAIEGWQPIYYRDVFEVYLDNNDIAKDLSAKPGRPYLTAPSNEAPTLAIATDKDKMDIISVDTWFCKVQLETIIVGYIPSSSIEASDIVNSLASAPAPQMSDLPEAAAVTELVGRFEKTGMIGKNRTGVAYKLTGLDGKTLAFVDTSEVPERIHVEDFIKREVRVSGILKQTEETEDVILTAKSIKNAF